MFLIILLFRIKKLVWTLYNLWEIKYFKLLEENKGRHFTDKELCELLDVTQENLDNIKHSANINTFSMNQTTGDDNETELGSFLASPSDSYSDVEEKMASRNLFLVMKEYLNDCEYYVLFHRILDNPQWTLEQLGESLGVTRERIRQLEAKVLKKVKPIMASEHKRLSITNKIRDREGSKIDFLTIEPISPDKIMKYLFIKDELTLKEKKLLHLMYFGKYTLNRRQTASFLKLTLEECNLIYHSLMNKMKEKFENKDKFESYRNSLLKNFGTKIFSVDLNSDLKIIDYDYLHDKYINLSYAEVISLINDSGYELTSAELSLLDRFYKVPVRSHTMNEEMFLTDINLSVFLQPHL